MLICPRCPWKHDPPKYRPEKRCNLSLDCPYCWRFNNDARFFELWKSWDESQRCLPEPPATEPGPCLKAYPNILRQVVSLAAARKVWRAAGKPVRSDDERQRIHLICEGCECFDAERDRCRACGCGLSEKSSVSNTIRRLGLVDAIAMATYSCPAGKWGTDASRPH